EEQGGAEERTFLSAQARSLEGFRQPGKALEAWKMLAEQHPFSEEGRKAKDAIRRLTGAVAGQPYLGLSFVGESATVEITAPGGPADKAGLQPGDKLRNLNDFRIASLADVRRALDKIKPGDKLRLV